MRNSPLRHSPLTALATGLWLAIVLGVLLQLLTPSLASAWATYGCGLKPLPPLGCKSSNATCICDSQGRCEWIFTGCK